MIAQIDSDISLAGLQQRLEKLKGTFGITTEDLERRLQALKRGGRRKTKKVRKVKEMFGSDAQGRDIYKDSKGYYVMDWSPEKGEFKLHINAKGILKKPIAVLQCTRKGKGCLWKLTKNSNV